MNREEWVNKGFVDEPVDKSIDLKAAINELKKEKNAVILGHYYQKGEIQDIATTLGTVWLWLKLQPKPMRIFL